MCGRFFVDAKNREIDRLLDELGPARDEVKLGEVFPSDPALVLASENSQILPKVLAWGFPRREGKGVIFNARAETALSKPFFRFALLRNPLLVPASGFYEWAKIPDSRRKNKYFFYNPRGGLLYLAGFGKEKAFTIITREANESVAFCHDRMPVLIEADERGDWLSGNNIADFLERPSCSLACELAS